MDEAEISWKWDLFKQVQKKKSELPLEKKFFNPNTRCFKILVSFDSISQNRNLNI